MSKSEVHKLLKDTDDSINGLSFFYPDLPQPSALRRFPFLSPPFFSFPYSLLLSLSCVSLSTLAFLFPSYLIYPVSSNDVRPSALSFLILFCFLHILLSLSFLFLIHNAVPFRSHLQFFSRFFQPFNPLSPILPFSFLSPYFVACLFSLGSNNDLIGLSLYQE